VPPPHRRRQTVATLERLVAERDSTPAFIRCDNGPELTANALRDWCRFARAGSAYIEPGSPWQNPYVESFGSRVRDELLSVELFSCLAEARVLIEDWRQDYNHYRPHSALGMMTPTRFALGYRDAHLAAAHAGLELRSPSGLASFDAGDSPTLQTNTTHQLSQQVDR
jgi:transposase InsO family protein